MQTLYETDTLMDTSSRGGHKFWVGRVVTDGTDMFTTTDYWVERIEGEKMSNRSSAPKKIEGKNIGRSNETTPKEQAISEIDSAAEKKKDKGYWVKGQPKPKKRPLPMLAHRYDKRSHDIEFPALVQPKLDGMRCLLDSEEAWSRKGKQLIPEVIRHLLLELPKDVIALDGELMLPHGEGYTFQDTIRAVKKFRPDVSPKLVLHVYDIILKKEILCDKRLAYARHLVNNLKNEAIVWTTTLSVKDENQLFVAYQKFSREGYEGAMVRNMHAPYKLKRRSKHLQKLKSMETEEFKIVGYQEGRGKDKGTVIFTCLTSDGQQFNVRPKGTHEHRAELFEKGQSLIGEKLTVQYQDLSEDGVPRFPVGLAIRNYE